VPQWGKSSIRRPLPMQDVRGEKWIDSPGATDLGFTPKIINGYGFRVSPDLSHLASNAPMDVRPHTLL